MIKIKKSQSADTRSAKEPVSKETLLASSEQHISDVRKAIGWMRDRLAEHQQVHDWTKIHYLDEFHRDFSDVQQNPEKDFKALTWYPRHVNTERHHLNDRCPDDVDLFDVLERIADITMAGMGRSGKIFDDHLSVDILHQAYQNTIKKLAAEIVVED